MWLIITTALSFGIIDNVISLCDPTVCLASSNGGNFGAPSHPQEYNTTDIEVNSGDKVTLPCPNAVNHFWSYPFLEERLQRSDYATERHQDDIVDKAEFLLIPKATYANTGLYVCTKNDSEDVAYYLYVKDTKILSLTNTRPFFADVIVSQGLPAEIPCTPTSKDVKVDLYLRDLADPKKSSKVEINFKNKIAYSPQTGFTTNDTNTPGVRIYTCKFTRDEMEEILTSRLIVRSNDFSVPFGMVSQMYTNKLGRLILQCAYNDNGSENVSIQWIIPQGPSDKRIYLSSFKKTELFSNQTVSKLIIYNAGNKDEGFYHCKISKNDTDFSISEIFVTLHKQTQ